MDDALVGGVFALVGEYSTVQYERACIYNIYDQLEIDALIHLIASSEAKPAASSEAKPSIIMTG